jgi:hypothetical protein
VAEVRRKSPTRSSRSHSLHRQYPLRLRSLGDFIRGTPSTKDRELQHNVSLLRDQVQRLIRTVESLRTTHVHSTVFDREGGETATTLRSPKRYLVVYQLIPANGHHNLGKTRLTHKHVQASAKEARMPIIWDSGASISLSFNRADFVGVMKPVSKLTRHQGIANGLSVEGRGHVLWPMLDTNGQLRLLKVPELSRRIVEYNQSPSDLTAKASRLSTPK